MYTEQRESVEQKLSKMTEMAKIAENESAQVQWLLIRYLRIYFQDPDGAWLCQAKYEWMQIDLSNLFKYKVRGPA